MMDKTGGPRVAGAVAFPVMRLSLVAKQGQEPHPGPVMSSLRAEKKELSCQEPKPHRTFR
jgi:hypothetical protein